MSNVKRSEIYAELHGVEVVNGEFVDMTHTVVGRHGDIAKYVARAKKLSPDFLAREVRVYRATFAMSITDFMANAQPVGDPVDIRTCWAPTTTTRRRMPNLTTMALTSNISFADKTTSER